MPQLVLSPPPFSPAEPVTEILHGVAVTDPYRWLEEQDSPRTRQWIAEQTRYARSYLDSIPGREKIQKRIRELLDVETFDSLQKAGERYFFRKRLAGQEQPSIYLREGPEGRDQLLVDPSAMGKGTHIAIKPLRVSSDGKLLLYETKEGGERTGTFALFDVEKRRALPDVLPQGYLRGFAFAPDGKTFSYVHEPAEAKPLFRRAAFQHVIGTDFCEDRKIFSAGDHPATRLSLVSGGGQLGFLVYHFLEKTLTSFYIRSLESTGEPQCVIEDVECSFGPVLLPGKILAITDRDAPNLRIIELRPADLRLGQGREAEWVEIVPEGDGRIQQWTIAGERILVLSGRGTDRRIASYDLSGKKIEELPIHPEETVRIAGGTPETGEVFLERESFTEPISIARYSPGKGECAIWAKRQVPFDASAFSCERVSYPSKDGTRIPMWIAGRKEVLAGGCHPAILTSYGGYGVPMTPQFSVFVAFLIERGCLFALPNIRGGSEFGREWHEAAKRRKRQTAYDDFLAAAEWLIETERTRPERLAIFGGSNSGLLVGAAMTQRPELFCAVVCMVPMLDMLRYHLFDNAHVWREEFGTAEDREDFAALRAYSPYHQVREGTHYPATMLVSGDADRNCNPLHARKMTARLQAANASSRPVFLDYSPYRGHSPVLPLSDRIEALTDRMAFLSDQLQLKV